MSLLFPLMCALLRYLHISSPRYVFSSLHEPLYCLRLPPPYSAMFKSSFSPSGSSIYFTPHLSGALVKLASLRGILVRCFCFSPPRTLSPCFSVCRLYPQLMCRSLSSAHGRGPPYASLYYLCASSLFVVFFSPGQSQVSHSSLF